MIRNRLEAFYILQDFFLKIFNFNVKLGVQKGPRGKFELYKPKYELLKKEDRHVRAACTLPVVLTFFKLAFVFFKKNIKNSDFGKCRGITVASTAICW
jgi:hypothetical protein